MAKPEWGVKRVCQSCAAKFYDLNRSPITCPKCAAPFDPEALLKSRRSRPVAPAKIAKPKPAEDAKIYDNGDAAAGQSGDDEDDDSVLQNTSDLGGDDASEVVVTKRDDDN